MLCVSVLGTGLMGTGMAHSLMRSGMTVRAWNRTPARAQPLADDGAELAADPAAAVDGADVVLTMLFDADAVEAVMSEALPAMKAGAVWVQAATVGIDAAERFARMAEAARVGFVDAPVLGTKKPAEDGSLVVLAAGDESVRATAQPVLEAISSRTVWVGERPGDGHRLKLAANSWVLSITGATAQAVALARGLGVDPRLFLEVISGGATDSAYAQLKGAMMLEEEFPPSFTCAGAVKDTALIAEAMRAAGTRAEFMAALNGLFRDAAQHGHSEQDIAAVLYAFATDGDGGGGERG